MEQINAPARRRRQKRTRVYKTNTQCTPNGDSP